MSAVNTDFLVIGSGVAGLRAAIELSRRGRVMVVTKDVPTESCTEYAQGGVAVALSDEDEVGIHFEDTIKAGDGLCRENAVRVLVEEGPERILELMEWGARFDKKGSKLSFTREAAHSRHRILHAHGDSTGKEIERSLIAKVKTLGSVERFPFSTAADLIVEEGRCRGAVVLAGETFLSIYARATILATGGTGQIYSRTTNPNVATGDGLGLAFRAGAVLEDMEFVQFHPTALFIPTAPQFLLSEAMRGEGAILRNTCDLPFMSLYHPDRELAPRDVVSRAIVSELAKTKSSHVYLDLTHLDPDFVKRRFPRIYETCLQYDLDITRDMIPVSPAAHYMMGGVKTDLAGASTIPGLFAAGEVACTGVHGANRLASNSLLEGLVYGYRASVAAADYADTVSEESVKTPVSYAASAAGSLNPSEVRSLIRRTMWEQAGIIRNETALIDARSRLEVYRSSVDHPFETRQGLELRNMLAVALAIIEAALSRCGSVGAHYRSDCPERGPEWQRHINMRLADGVITLGSI